MLDKEPKEEHPLAHVNMARGCSSFYLHGFSLTISSEVLIFSITSYYNRQITIYFLLLVQLTSWTIKSLLSHN